MLCHVPRQTIVIGDKEFDYTIAQPVAMILVVSGRQDKPAAFQLYQAVIVDDKVSVRHIGDLDRLAPSGSFIIGKNDFRAAIDKIFPAGDGGFFQIDHGDPAIGKPEQRNRHQVHLPVFQHDKGFAPGFSAIF